MEVDYLWSLELKVRRLFSSFYLLSRAHLTLAAFKRHAVHKFHNMRLNEDDMCQVARRLSEAMGKALLFVPWLLAAWPTNQRSGRYNDISTAFLQCLNL